MKKIKYAIILMFIIFSVFSVAIKAEEKENANEESQSAQHETGTPLVYYLNWAGLIVMFVFVLGELRNIKKEIKNKSEEKAREFYEAGSEKPKDLEHISQKPVFKPLFLILIAVLIFICEQLPVLSDFHENLALGYFRFIFKILVGILMLSYGLSSMEEEHH